MENNCVQPICVGASQVSTTINGHITPITSKLNRVVALLKPVLSRAKAFFLFISQPSKSL